MSLVAIRFPQSRLGNLVRGGREYPLERLVAIASSSSFESLREEVSMPLSRKTLWIGAALAVAAAIVLLAVFAGGGGGGAGY
jgi:hypothetical protein